VTAVSALALLFVAGCSTPSDLQRLQGAWTGKEKSQGIDCKIVVTGSQVDFTAQSGHHYKGTIILDEKASPKSADYTVTESGMPQYIGKTTRAIYEIREDGKVIMSANEPGVDARPTSFDPSGGMPIFEMTREAAAK
jgi:uncharacterized protein (TIGR03067 family)